MQRRCAVLGKPIAHSLSPRLHRAAYEALGLDWTYEALEVDERSLPGFLQGLPSSWRGLSLTMPLKRAVLPLLDETSTLVALTGAANTVVLDEDGRRRGDNTDVGGMVEALAGHGVVSVGSALLLGGGATAAAALAALRQLGREEVTVALRDPARAQPLLAAAKRLDVAVQVLVLEPKAVLPPCDLLISTLPAAAAAPFAGLAGSFRVVFDVAYEPWPTPLAQAAAESGCVLVSGIELLVAQAAVQVELMTGMRAPRAEMRAAAEAARPAPDAPPPQGGLEGYGGDGGAH